MLENEKLKIASKIKEVSKYKRPIWPYVVLIGLLLWAAISLGNSNAKYRGENEATAKSLEDIHQELNALRDDYSKFKTNTETKQQSIEQQISIKPARPIPVQPVRPAGGCESFRDLIDDYAWNVDTAIRVCNADSGGRVDAVNAGDRHATCLGSYGLYQIDCSWYSKANLFDPQVNIRLAYGKYLGGGWFQPWKNTCIKIGCVN